MKLYQWDSNGCYLRTVNVADDSSAVPERTTSLKPPASTADQVPYWTGGEWVLGALPTPAPEPTPDWPALIAARRYQAETGGTVFDGMTIATDDRSQALITGAAVAALMDADYSLQWKTASGFVQLTAQQVLALASAVRAHVQACFDREAALLAAVDDGSITEAMVGEGWP